MKERTKENFFILVRIALIFGLAAYGTMNLFLQAGVSVGMLLLVAFFISVLVVREVFPKPYQKWFLLLSVILYALILYLEPEHFLMLGPLLVFEIVSHCQLAPQWYLLAAPFCVALCYQNSIAAANQVFLIILIAILYIQHNYIVLSYKKQMSEDVITEQSLKQDIHRKENEAKEELRKSILLSENRILEERASLSQTLHDKLGHNINGSVYQLEAVKLLMQKDPDKAQQMVQGVIDQLRGGMDEIRAILRKERPEKKQLAMIQLYHLLDDCNSKGVEAELTTEGELSVISDKQWEIILDNAFEAVSNSMKYSKCKHINVKIVAVKKFVRASISDDGIGCETITDGMGISGMRKRMREVGGMLSFENHPGFTVTMLFPLDKEDQNPEETAE